LAAVGRAIDLAGTRPVAVVAGRHISVSRLELRVAEVRRGPRGRHLPPDGGSESIRLRRWIVQELVAEEVLAHEARAAGIIDAVPDADPAVGESPAEMSPAALGRLIERVTASVTVAPRDVRAYYVRNRDLYRRGETRRMRHILRSDEASARLAADRLAAGDVGEIQDLHRGELAGPLEDAIFAAEIGATVGPIQSEHGWHVARVEAVTSPSCVPYAEARPAIRADLLAAARLREFAAWLEQRRTALAVIEPEFEHPGHPIHGLPTHRH
jgi:[acyl-carrier-protein] S-malonyltransferase